MCVKENPDKKKSGILIRKTEVARNRKEILRENFLRSMFVQHFLSQIYSGGKNNQKFYLLVPQPTALQVQEKFAVCVRSKR